MSWYEAKPVKVRAAKILSIDDTEATFDLGDGDEVDWLQNALSKKVGDEGAIWTLNAGLRIGTLEGTMRADAGDYIVCGTSGEIYSVKPSIFEAKYKPTTAP